MQCPETEEYAENICDAVECELRSLDSNQMLLNAANKYFAGVAPPPPHLLPNSRCYHKWPILLAWRWLIRIPEKELLFNVLRSPESTDTLEVEGPMDLAYRCILPAPLGYAIHKMDIPPCAVETPEDVATIMDIRLAAKEAEERKALLR